MAVQGQSLPDVIGEGLVDNAESRTVERISFDGEGRGTGYVFTQSKASAGFWGRGPDGRGRYTIANVRYDIVPVALNASNTLRHEAMMSNRTDYALILHGGAGPTPGRDYSPVVAHLSGLIAKGEALLDAGRSALDVVEVMVTELERSGLYVAGRGSAPNASRGRRNGRIDHGWAFGTRGWHHRRARPRQIRLRRHAP